VQDSSNLLERPLESDTHKFGCPVRIPVRFCPSSKQLTMTPASLVGFKSDARVPLVRESAVSDIISRCRTQSGFVS
jgi:hypothetical protein